MHWPRGRRRRSDDDDLPKIAGDRVVCPNCAGEVTLVGQGRLSVGGAVAEAASLVCKSCGWISREIEWRGKVERILFSKADSSGEPSRESVPDPSREDARADDSMNDRPRRLVMRAEIGAESPIWDEQGVMVRLDSLRLPPQLQHKLTKWAEVGWEGNDDAVNAQGRRLYEEAVQALAPTDVAWDND